MAISILSSPLAGTVLVLFVLYYIVGYVRFHTKYRFPALVPGVPFFGNALQIPKDSPRLYFQQLAKKHGEMFTLKMGTNYWVFLNSKRVVTELLEKRASIYISRQNLPMAGEIVSGNKRLVFLPHNELWKKERKIMHEILGPSQRGLFAPLQDIETRALLHDYLTRPEDWYKSHGRYSNSIIMNVVFGRRTKSDDANLALLLEISENFLRLLDPGSSFIDNFPFLNKLPLPKSLQPWRWWGDREYERTLKCFKTEFDALAERQLANKSQPCFMTEFYRLGKDKEFDAETIYFLAGTLMEAGSDTTRISLNQLVAGSALYPDWIERARKDLDEVCGKNAERLPDMNDAPHLPLIKAAVKETVRWNPTLGEIAHSLTRDDTFEGYHFPAGTNVTWNHWAICMDPNEYEQPERFWPDRFMNEDLDKPLKGHFGFGAGRRVCAGWYVATQNLYLSIARLVYCFNFHVVPGAPIPVGKPFTISSNTPPFQVKITVRSPEHAALIERESASAIVE